MLKFISPKILFFLIIIFGSILRLYNLNFDDLWIDEFSSFWAGNPNIDLHEAYKNHISLEQTPFLFNFFSRCIFFVFGYNVEFARFIPLICSILSIVTITFISKKFSNKNCYLLVAFLISFNIFLISYAQEFRVYSTFFLFSTLSIFYFLIINQNKKLKYLFLFILNTIILIFLHHYSIIILFSYLCFFFTQLSYFKRKELIRNFIISIIIFIFASSYYYFSIKNSVSTPEWMLQPDIKFYTNFYFSKFFGSRLLGLFFLILLIFLIIVKFKILIKNDLLKLLFIILILSYTIPLVFGYIYRPIILPRYIIFVLIPISILLSHLIFEFSKVKKYVLIFLLVFLTVGNLTTEETFKQFFNERRPHKPQIYESLLIVSNDNINILYNLVNTNEVYLNNSWKKASLNYLNYLSKKNDFNIYIIEDYTNLKNLWIMCIHDLNQNNCNLPKNFKLQKKIDLNRLTLFKLIDDKI